MSRAISKLWLMLAGLPVILPVGDALAGAVATTHVGVAVHIDTIAQVSFPKGTRFTMVVPKRPCQPVHEIDERHCEDFPWPPIHAVSIPFVVRGNARAFMTARPDSFIRIRSGAYLGRAAGKSGNEIGYQAIVRFPVPEAAAAWRPDAFGRGNSNVLSTWSGFRKLPFLRQLAELSGANGSGTPPLEAQLPKLRGSALGVVYVVAARHWTRRGQRAAPGVYHGSIEVTVTALR